MTNIVNQFKETAAFEDLQDKICSEIAGVFLARLKEMGVADDQLDRVSDDICYDIVSAMSEIGDITIPGAEDYDAALQEKTEYIAALEARVNEMTTLEVKLKKMTALEAKIKEITAVDVKVKEIGTLEAKINEVAAQDACFDNMDASEEKTDKIVHFKVETKAQALPDVDGVLSQDKILSILNAAHAATEN